MRQWPHSFARSPSLRLQALDQQQPSTLQLWFSKRLSLPIFTGSRILEVDGKPINIVLMDKSSGKVVPTSLPHAIKLEIVVLDGDFPPDDNDEDWTSEEFNRHIVKERIGKRPLLAGELNVIMRDGIAPTGDIEFTDNSSWIRCRKFRVAVRVVPGTNPGGVRIREAMTEAFVVKDHRGECKLQQLVFQFFYIMKYIYFFFPIFFSGSIYKDIVNSSAISLRMIYKHAKSFYHFLQE